MDRIGELRFWVDVIERLAVPQPQRPLTSAEKQALSQSCRVLAQNAEGLAMMKNKQ